MELETPQQVMAVIPAEIRATVNLYLDGKVDLHSHRVCGRRSSLAVQLEQPEWGQVNSPVFRLR